MLWCQSAVSKSIKLGSAQAFVCTLKYSLCNFFVHNIYVFVCLDTVLNVFCSWLMSFALLSELIHILSPLQCLSNWFSSFCQAFNKLISMNYHTMTCIVVSHNYVIRTLRINVYRMSQEECARLRENVPYVKVRWYNPKHLYPKLNGYGDNGQRKVWSSCGSTYCTC